MLVFPALLLLLIPHRAQGLKPMDIAALKCSSEGVACDSRGRITKLYLDGKGITGSIPPKIGLLTSLQIMDLRNNQLTGTLPAEIGRLTEMRVMSVSNNALEGSLPVQIGNLTSLQKLYAHSNAFEGPLPASLFTLRNLTSIYLFGNRLSGSLPKQISQLSQLQTLALTGNRFSGPLPEDLGQLRGLQRLYLDRNDLSGSIPETLGGLSSATHLFLSHNEHLSGSIPVSLSELPLLAEIDVTNTDVRCDSRSTSDLKEQPTVHVEGCKSPPPQSACSQGIVVMMGVVEGALGLHLNSSLLVVILILALLQQLHASARVARFTNSCKKLKGKSPRLGVGIPVIVVRGGSAIISCDSVQVERDDRVEWPSVAVLTHATTHGQGLKLS